MTTSVTIKTHDTWKVEVTGYEGDLEATVNVVPLNSEQTFHVWDGKYLVIKELPAEKKVEAVTEQAVGG